MLTTLETIEGVGMNLSISRDAFRITYLSANVINYDEEAMPQRRRGFYRGSLYVMEARKPVSVSGLETILVREKRTLGEVIEGFHFGASHQRLVATYPATHVLGTIWEPIVGACFCPQLFMFGPVMSYGIEHFRRAMPGEGPMVDAGTVFIAVDKRG